MSNKTPATDTNNAPAGDTAATFRAAHNGHPLTHVGSVVNPNKPQTGTDPRGGVPASFDVWYCQLDHVTFIDNAS